MLRYYAMNRPDIAWQDFAAPGISLLSAIARTGISIETRF